VENPAMACRWSNRIWWSYHFFVLNICVLQVTTAETKTGVLLIAQFKTLINNKLWPPGIISGWPFSYESGLARISFFCQSERPKAT
jgi:hypothetical protein